jgi:hypothetical protein
MRVSFARFKVEVGLGTRRSVTDHRTSCESLAHSVTLEDLRNTNLVAAATTKEN